jgi:hypothetical protein
VLAKSSNGLISIAIEGKVEEPFDKSVIEWLADASNGKRERLAYLNSKHCSPTSSYCQGPI